MSKHSGGHANEDLLRDLRLAVWRHKEPESEFMVLSQIRQTLDHAGVAYDGCRLYRVQDARLSLDVRWVLVSANGRTAVGAGGVEISRDLLSSAEPPRRMCLAGPADALPCQNHPRNDF